MGTSSNLLHKPSNESTVALAALTTLHQKEGVEQVGRVASECVKEDILRRYMKKYKLTESKSSDMCLCRLVGKRCPWRTGAGSTRDCITFDSEAIDHPSYFNRGRCPFVFISQPYSLSLEGMQSLVEVSQRHNLDVRVTNYSWYYPSGTLLIEVHRDGWYKEIHSEEVSPLVCVREDSRDDFQRI